MDDVEPGARDEIAQFLDAIESLRLHPQKRRPDLGEDRIDERVAAQPFGQTMAQVIDLDHHDRIEAQTVTDHEIDALGHHAAQRPAAQAVAQAGRRVGELGEPHLGEGAIVAPQRDVERP